MSPRADRPLAPPLQRGPVPDVVLRIGAVGVVIALLAFVVSRVDFTHDLHRLRARVLSGPTEGNYHAVVGRLADRATKRHGALDNVETAGSVDNVTRLQAASRTCEVAFALAQDGMDWGPDLKLVGRLPRSESVLFLGKNADDIHEFADLKGRRIGVGPLGSGADRIGRGLFALPDFVTLGVVLSNHGVDEQLALAERGDLDLALVVTNSEAPIAVEWVGKRGLQIASFAHTAGLARRLPHFKAGEIGAGLYDAVRDIPKTDKHVLKIETLVLGNGCASRVATMDLMSLLVAEFPDFVRHNKDTENTTGLPLVPAAEEFYANGGPQLADEYVPWLVDVMPPANWAYAVMGVSLLFNAMGAGHRFRLWRIDANRVSLEREISVLFPPHTTLRDIRHAAPEGALTRPESVATLRRVVHELEALAERSRRDSLSFLVPMGQEMAYRYQEGVILETLAVVRDLSRRCDAAATAPARTA